MKKMFLTALLAAAAASFGFGMTYGECMAKSSYNTCVSMCKPIYAMNNAQKAEQCEKECRAEHYEHSYNVCRKYK